MKNTALGISVAIGLAAVALPAAAQYYDEEKADRRFYISPMGTYSLYDSDREFDDTFGYQLSIGKILGRGANMEIHGTFAEPGADGAAVDGELLSYGVSFLLFQSRDDFPLYAILSISRGSAESPDADGEATSDQFDAGFGYLLRLGHWPLLGSGPSLRIEARYRTDKYSQGEASAYGSLFGTSGGRTYHDGVFGIGLFLPLGADPNAAKDAEEPSEPDTRIVITQPDSDGDQIPDEMDACPGTPQGVTINAQGCEHDYDKDGVPNSRDACQGTPASADVGPDGCRPDGDGDGVIDATDQCPNSPAGAPVMADGCALRNDCRIPSPGQRIDASGCAAGAVVLEGVNFKNGSAELTAVAKSVLDRVATAIGAAEGVRIEVAGHTDSVGDAAYNLRLSQLRANAVRNYLLQNGVDGKVLIAKGYGETQPLVPNETEQDRRTNRRVELKVADQ